MEQHETASAVGVFHHPRRRAGLAEQRRLLIPGDASDAHRRAEPVRFGQTEIGRRSPYRRQHRAGHSQVVQQGIVPAIGANIEHQRARGVGDVGGVHASAGQAPDQPAIHRAESQFAALGARTGAGHCLQDPRQLGAGEIGIEQQAGALAEQGLQPLGLECIAGGGGAAILPDDGVVNRPPGGAFPDQRGLALVGDAQRQQIPRPDARLRQRLASGVELALPDQLGVMLDPARLGIDLGKFLLRQRHQRPVGIEHEGARTGRSLVQGQQISHVVFSPRHRISSRDPDCPHDAGRHQEC